MAFFGGSSQEKETFKIAFFVGGSIAQIVGGLFWEWTFEEITNTRRWTSKSSSYMGEKGREREREGEVWAWVDFFFNREGREERTRLVLSTQTIKLSSAEFVPTYTSCSGEGGGVKRGVKKRNDGPDIIRIERTRRRRNLFEKNNVDNRECIDRNQLRWPCFLLLHSVIMRISKMEIYNPTNQHHQHNTDQHHQNTTNKQQETNKTTTNNQQQQTTKQQTTNLLSYFNHPIAFFIRILRITRKASQRR